MTKHDRSNQDVKPSCRMKLQSIPTDQVAAWWPDAAPFIARACRRSMGEWTPEMIRAECEAGRARLMVAGDAELAMAGAVSLARNQDGALVCHILGCAGRRMSEWVHVLDELEEWARYHGATLIRFHGRHGWGRALKGYRSPLAIFEKDLAS